MKIMKKKLLYQLLIFSIVLSSWIPTNAADTFVVDQEESFIPIPKAYEVKGTIKNLGEYGFFSHPEDIYLDEEGNLYVADTENNRVVKMTQKGEIIKVYTEAFGVPLNKPKGVYVHYDGSLWIADTGNLRIVSVYEDGTDRKIYGKPDSMLLESSFTFDPEKIYATRTGYIYALKGANLMTMDEQNEFRGYLGATDVEFSLSRLLIRTFGTKEQIERTLKQQPASYTNFMIGSDGMVYGILANAETAQIRKLNSVGKNTYPEEKYGLSIMLDGKTYTKPRFSDIAVADNGIITLVDRNTALIYQYDQEGNLLAAFGGMGEYNGTFQIPIGIVVNDEGDLFILDYNTNTVTIFEPTKFIQLVHNAVTSYNAGKYEEAKSYWEQVLAIDSNYALAHQGVAKVLFKEEQYEKAMDEYRLADDKEGYSKAFSEYRHELFRAYFGWVVLITAIIGFVIYKLVDIGKRKSDQWAHRIEMGGELG